MGTVYTLYKADQPAKYVLGKGQWFRICKNENYVVFRMNELWTAEELGVFVRRAVAGVNGMGDEGALAVAHDILDWCGDDRVVMIADTDDHLSTLKDLGVPARRHRQTGSIWSVDTKPVTPEEREENARLRREVMIEEDEMFRRAIAMITTTDRRP